jgi:hypothetical protein
MCIFLTFIVTWLQISPTLADASLITKKTDSKNDKDYYTYTCADKVGFRGDSLPFSKVIWNTKQNAMYFSCCYKHHALGRDYCPPDGQIDLKGKVIPNTCQVGKAGLTGCVPSNTLSESLLDRE